MSNGEADIEVAPNWIRATEESRDAVINALEKNEWNAEMLKMPEGEPSLGDERIWCDYEIFEQLCEAKRILNEHSSERIEEVRSRSNPHEPLVNNKAMVGRMSVLLAAIDRVCDFLLTDENIDDAETKSPLDGITRGINIDRGKDLFYFAETQSMNGAYASQYVMIRKGFYNAKCFIPRASKEISPLVSLSLLDTLMKRDDQFDARIAFNPFTCNMRDKFKNLVHQGTHKKGVHLYAGFTHNHSNPGIGNKDQSRGDQGHKEILFRDSYVGQLFYVSSLVREGGKAILQFLDTNTSTTVAVLYLAHIIFDRVSIYKPNMSRPSNAEKFLICDGLRGREARIVHQYIKRTMDDMKPGDSIRRLIPDNVMDRDRNFIEYFYDANNCLAKRQHKFLQSYLRMLGDELIKNTHQKDCLRTCLPYYLIPYFTLTTKRSVWGNGKRRTPEEVLASILPQGMRQEDVQRFLSNHCRKMNAKGIAKESINNRGLVMTPCAAEFPYLIVSTMKGLFYLDRGHWTELSKDPCILPHETVLLADLYEIPVNKGTVLIVRVLDAAIIYGDNVSTLSFDKRRLAIAKLTEACWKDGYKSNVIITAARYERIDSQWKPDRKYSRVNEPPFHFENVKWRFVEDSSKSFFDMCRGEGVKEMEYTST